MSLELRERLADSQALIFDFDGTLAPNLDLPDMKRQVIEFTLANAVPESVFAGAHIVEIIQLASAWLGQLDLQRAQEYQRQAVALITRIELDAAVRTTVYPAVRPLLRRWRSSGRQSAIVTRNCREAVLGTYPAVLQEIDALLARDDVPHLKPDTRHLTHALQAVNATGARSIMVGDGQMDMQIGRAEGLYCVGVLGGSSDRQALLAAGADHVLEGVADFLPLVNRL